MRHGWMTAAVRRGVAALVISLSLAGPSSAWTCKCISDPEQTFPSASIVFRGTLFATEDVTASACDKHRFTYCRPHKVALFRVEQVLKGFPPTVVRIPFDVYRWCGPWYSTGESAWVAAKGDEDAGFTYAGCERFLPPDKGEVSPLADMIERYHRELRMVQEAAERHPTDPDTLMAVATFLSETGSRLQAIDMVDRLLAIEPLHRAGLLLKADKLTIGSDHEAVLAVLATYLAAYPGDQDALRRQVLTFVRLDRWSDVPEDWRDFTGLHGSDFDFSSRTLDDASFRGDYLTGVSFAGAQLQRADFSGATILGTFAGANLSGASLADARMFHVDFTGAILNRANLSGAELSNVKLVGASYDDGTTWPAGFDPVAAGAMKQQ